MSWTRVLMTASAAWLLLLALVLSFAGDTLWPALGLADAGGESPVLKITGALLLGFAMLNWMARGNIIGGIYSRPVAVGNFLHFAVACLSLLKPLFAGALSVPMIGLLIIHAAFAVAFGWLVFGQGSACVGSAE